MKDSPIGITFRETMAGGFALGESDPKAGEQKGRKAGTALAMHATITIRDLRKFIDSPEHQETLTGHIDVASFGNNIPAKTGVFNLFSPTDRPKLKFMVYELGFEFEGKDYYLAGKKEVQNDPGFDLWKDTTTLYTQLHKGPNKTGPVVGAGVLSLGVVELMKLVSTLRAMNTPSVAEGTKAIMEFGRFFMGELWDSYAKKLSL